MSANLKKNTGFLAAIAVLMIGGITAGVMISKNRSDDSDSGSSHLSYAEAEKQLDKKLKKINVSNVNPRKATIEINTGNLAEELPEIDKYKLSVQGHGSINLEIFSSTEKSSSGTDGWLNEIAEDFNKSGYTVDGKSASVSVRPIASGAAIDYIISGKYVPELYTPSNELWGEMVASQGVKTVMLEDRLAGNTAGILVSKDTYQKLEDKYGKVNISTIINATIDSEIAMGYTNPYASSTGLNFLVSALEEFDSKDILSKNSTQQFQNFQKNVPFVSYTTLQMRDAAKNGVLDAFIMEYQGYYNATELRGDYEFIPFGVRHDSPMYALGNLNSEQTEVAKAFTEFCLNAESQKKAKQYGFNYLDDYKGEKWDLTGNQLESAQKLWKTEKDAGSPVMAVFVADVSGSMGGVPLANLQQSLINASQYINSSNYIGLVSYSSDVSVNLPIGKFDINQRSYFTGAVQDLSASGNTCTYDAVLVGLDMIRKEQKKIEEETGQKIKPLLFVLSDGETNEGNSLNAIKPIVDGMQVPCYSICYNENLGDLERLSAINEAACIKADSDDVVYSLKSLFNAQM